MTTQEAGPMGVDLDQLVQVCNLNIARSLMHFLSESAPITGKVALQAPPTNADPGLQHRFINCTMHTMQAVDGYLSTASTRSSRDELYRSLAGSLRENLDCGTFVTS